MAPKRKAAEHGEVPSAKKPHIGLAEDEVEVPALTSPSYESSDDIVKFTDNGTKRAESEARRQWVYACEVEGCGQRFNRPCRLEAHTRTHTKERPFACPEDDCDKTFPRKDHLQRHIKVAHGEGLERNFVCDWDGCGKSFTSNGRLQRHKEVHESKFYCTGYPPCKEIFRKEKTLQAHIKSQHLEVKPYPCTQVDEETGEQCAHGYQTEGALRRHVAKAHSGEKEDKHFCMICIPPKTEVETIVTEGGETITIPKEPLSFATNEELLAHSREVHPPICSECGVRFKNQSNLKAHVETVHADPKDQPQFPCPRPGCDSVFNRKSNLSVHIQSVHDKQPRFFCTSDAMKNSKHPDLQGWDGQNACGAPFKAKASLDQHIRTQHLGLGNRKEARKNAKARKRNPEPSTVTLLTGIGYEKGRDVSCLVKGCEYRFFMDRDLRRHLRSTHSISDNEIEEMIRERDALTGGQFWIGGVDEPVFESADPSMPQTPAPYSLDSIHMPHGMDGLQKIDPQLGYFEQQFDDMHMHNAEEAEMDMAMGLDGLAPAVDAQEGLQWDMLAPVEQYNMRPMED